MPHKTGGKKIGRAVMHARDFFNKSRYYLDPLSVTMITPLAPRVP